MTGSSNKPTPPTEERRRLMQRVRRTDTAPEILVREVLSDNGYRFSRHVKTLPGTPDIVFSKLKKAIFVHGCFWHAHTCKRGTTPKTNRAFWIAKFDSNRLRDRRNVAGLKTMGYRALVVWECQTYDLTKLERKLKRFLQDT
jgi:DNA mismatch endonuclease, patch repair protein